MDIPDLVQQALGGEEIQAGVSIGDEDAVCFTPTRTLVYRGEGLLSDESIDEYPHDVERLAVSEGRRKTKFVLSYVDGDRSFTVPGNRASRVLEPLLEGVLRVADVIGPTESINGVFRFSELTLAITERRLVKHVGEPVWDEDFEVFDYDDVTELSFEKASVATQIVLTVDGRPQRIKAPNEQAPMVRQTLEGALFAHYEVDSLEALNQVATRAQTDPAAADDPSDGGDAGATDDLGFEGGIDPLVTDSDDDQQSTAGQGPTEQPPAREHSEQGTGGRKQRDPPASDASGTGGHPGDHSRTDQSGAEGHADRPPEGRDPDARGGREQAERSGQPPTDQGRQPATDQGGQPATDQGGHASDASGGRSSDRGDQSRPDQSRTDQRRPDQGRPDQGRTEEGRTDPAGDSDPTTDRSHDARSEPGHRTDPSRGEQREPAAEGQPATDTTDSASQPEHATESADRQPGRAGDASAGGGTSREHDSAHETVDTAETGGAGERRDAAPSEGGDSADQARSGTDTATADPATQENVEAIMEQLGDLTDAVRRQNELLEQQHKAIRTLAARLEDEE